MIRVAIIGGGPAGSAAAAALLRSAERGVVEVTVLEARAFPRSKVCGEFISPAATDVLESLVGSDTLCGAGARRVDRLVLELEHGETSWPLPSPAWTLSRRSLDDLLLRAAVCAGARVIQPAAVRGVEYAVGAVRVRLGDSRDLEADVVVHADGFGRFDDAGATPSRPGVLGFKCFIQPPQPVEGIRMRASRGAYVGTVAVERGRATLALVARAELLRAAAGDIDRMVGGLWPAFRAAWRQGEWLTCGVANSSYIEPGHLRSFRIGNAAGAVEPVGGEGIGLALWSGERLGKLLAEIAGGREPIEQRLATTQLRLAREYRHRLRMRRPACRLAAEALMRPGLVRAAWPLLRVPGVCVRPWYRLTGKPLRARTS